MSTKGGKKLLTTKTTKHNRSINGHENLNACRERVTILISDFIYKSFSD